MLVELTLDANNRKRKVARTRTKDLARGAHVAKPNYHRHVRRHPDTNDDSEESDGFELEANSL